MLEPLAMKVARAVLRGGDGSNAISLPDQLLSKVTSKAKKLLDESWVAFAQLFCYNRVKHYHIERNHNAG